MLNSKLDMEDKGKVDVILTILTILYLIHSVSTSLDTRKKKLLQTFLLIMSI